MTEWTLEQEQAAFNAQLDALLQTDPGKFALVKNGAVIDLFPNHEAAYEAGLARFGLDTTFLIAPIETPSSDPVSIAWESGVMFG